MTTKERIQAEIEQLAEDDLNELYHLVKIFAQSKQHQAQPSVMEKLRSIKINAPPDFSANFTSP